MTSQEILTNIFKIYFRKGDYLKQLEPLDRDGHVDRRSMFETLVALLENNDQINDKLDSLEVAIRLKSTPTTPPEARSNPTQAERPNVPSTGSKR